MSTLWRDFLRRFHPEGIPWPGSVIYNAISQTEVFSRHYALVADHVGLYCRAGSILDIGTGPGWLLVALRRSLPELGLVGMDISPAMVATARQNVKKAGYDTEIDLGAAAAEALPFPDESFDAVVSTGSLHHWKRPLAALNEVHRVLKAGGCALVYDLVRKLPPAVAEAAKREFGSLRTRMLWLHSFEEPFYNVQDMEALSPATSFESVQTEFVGVLCCLILQKSTTALLPFSGHRGDVTS
jgi:ubiquinone/menaquinone biosynthesis C-methylase UbiE